MTFEEAIKKSIQKYFEDSFEESTNGPKVFNKEFFKSLEESDIPENKIKKTDKMIKKELPNASR